VVVVEVEVEVEFVAVIVQNSESFFVALSRFVNLF
jgi:hypothetical protein